MTSGQRVRSKGGARSWWSRARAVKHATQEYSGGGWQALVGRHLEGWPLAVVALSVALLGVALGSPRPVAPDLVPPPQVDVQELRHRARQRRMLAAQAFRQQLPFDARAVGEGIRRYGRALAGGQMGQGEHEARRLRVSVNRVRTAHGDRPLLVLRAVQTELFLGALLHWESRGTLNQDLVELGGDFLAKARASGWIGERLLLTVDERAVLFMVRWTALTGLLDTYPFAPTPNDWRLYYRFLLNHPEGAAASSGQDALSQKLEYVRALSGRDASYPAALARGVLLFGRGQYGAACTAFRDHLGQYPDGRWQLRVRNHLRACASRTALDNALAPGGTSR